MKNVTIFVDVDLTLVDPQLRMIEGADIALRKLKEKGCRLYLWSTGGADYARNMAGACGVADLFDAFLSKPDIIIDDTPSTAINPIVVNTNDHPDWKSISDHIAKRYLG